MAAYAALVSVTNIIDQIQRHPHPPISLDHTRLESLTARSAFLRDFLENHPTDDALENRIANAAYAAEDIIELHIVDQILAGPTSHGPRSNINFNRRLEHVMRDFDAIEREVGNVKEKHGIERELCKISISSGMVRSRPTRDDIIMVGLDDVKLDIMEELVGGSDSRQIVPIVGMGGIGKTTLARNVYLDSCVKHHFDILGWATVSQEHDAKKILLDLLICQNDKGTKESLNYMSKHELAEILYKSLVGRRYLIVLDDIWSIEAWDKVKFFFPNNNNGSRAMITTRLSNLAFELTGTHGHVMSLLDEDKSWNLLCRTMFGDEPCPAELEEIGKKIAENCKGLPLSIIVVGGLLAKSKPTREQWENKLENLDSIVKTEDDERCTKILQMSYDQLPVYLKPCFLYMGVYPEDCEIHVSNLMKLWVAEGFLKPIDGKTLEYAAREYFNELIDRNLIFVSRRGYGSKIKYCKIHDLFMDLCVREAQKHRFLFVTRLYNSKAPQDISNQRRVVIHRGTNPQIIHALKRFSPLVRSFTRKSYSPAESLNFRLMRVWNGYDRRSDNTNYYTLASNPGLINCRYIDCLNIPRRNTPIPRFWNIQTLIVSSGSESIEPLQIWKMPQLRHLKFDLLPLPDPDETKVVLENLQKLSTVRNFKCSRGVVERIPNIKKLRLFYDEGVEDWPSCCLDNIGSFERLESLSLHFSSPSQDYLSENLVFPRSVRKLSLLGTGLRWEEMAGKIGWLPDLEVLRLKVRSFVGPEWETVEGQFSSLKFLLVSYCTDLESWTIESSHFPCLEHVVLEYLYKLKELPREIGDIMTLRSIELEWCSYEAVVCARDIVEEQEELGNEDLRARVVLSKKDEEIESSTTRNFQVKVKEQLVNSRKARIEVEGKI